MKGKILGIITIFFLQLGFIGYTQVTTLFDASTEIGALSSPENPLAEISDLDFVDVEDSEVEPVYAKANNAPYHRNATLAVRKTYSKRPAFRTYDTDLDAVSIEVPRSPGYTFASYTRPEPKRRAYHEETLRSEPAKIEEPVRVHTVERRKKRSLASKTFAVIKKPFDWMKALGSKLK